MESDENSTDFQHESEHLPNIIYFSWFDYTLFTITLSVSAIIGIYFGCFGKKQNSVAEYILGGKTMSTIPIALSLIASDVSGESLLAVSTDIYTFGASNWFSAFGIIISGFATKYIYLPIFFKLQLTSSYEYLKLRFDRNVRLMASFLFILSNCLYLPIVIYIPALAFNQVTGSNIYFVTILVCVICVFYTTIGGLKAVVWTDALQFIIMMAAILAVFVLGILATGSLGEIFQKSYEGGRLFLYDFDPDPLKRTTVWNIIGMATSWTSYVSVTQNCVQKFLALPTLSKANSAVMIFLVGLIMVKSLAVITGLIIYAKYSDCDPLKSKQISEPDQLMPYFIMDVAGSIPGLPGLFIAGLFCAALSTMSAGLNSIAGVTYIDFIKPFMVRNITEKQASDIMKWIVVIIGILSTTMVFMVAKLGSILPVAISLGGVVDGPLLGMFTLGAMMPYANSKGTLSGGICGLVFIAWIATGAQVYRTNGFQMTQPLPVSVEGCSFSVDNLRNNTTSAKPEFVVPWVYKISVYYYCLIGCAVTIIVGAAISCFTGGCKQVVERKFLSPIIYFALPKEDKRHATTDNAVEMMPTDQ